MRRFLMSVAICAQVGCSGAEKKETPAVVEAEKVEASTPAKAVAAEASAAATGKKATGTVDSEVTCKSGSDVRKIRVVKRTTGCGVEYDKNGETSEVASAAADLNHCPTIKEKMASNLTGAGFECQ